ncbi:PTS N-acetylglucosamine transporter subunit IIBC [Holdemania massiliensis]|uniref:PTS N-acetylglucosamine transporter subunit IIBC n=1 Tax=Holdemania massiliensis TaxID=1468449 RepID=A0A6N7S688_9FIRM|nr:PTS N-acetylglucosamine transporter subunit IIBC [Holdemania massiliensis]MSA89140.1 PTS N-acetylglucosamine transporter subunit IIBC [Holdemania massiliensis]MSB77969.1 PTS N-acetylglucosamine transporter subunit IIBC [Holdemania massiliensis]MSC32858.1 PTS N-acetylglucosamine transporter subunit IIBC [Holdemania massiliensis]MSC39215.1 PTS N-acetylglucosamine transporter subunit IIBC [Holdemania massiliensis]
MLNCYSRHDGVGNSECAADHYRDTEQLAVINAFAGSENPSDLIQAYFQKLNKQDEVIILTDLPCGSVNQMLMSYLKRPQTHLVSGVNLSLVLALMLDQTDTDTADLIRQAVIESRQQILYINEKIEQLSAEPSTIF